jgi:hypothetical protein
VVAVVAWFAADVGLVMLTVGGAVSDAVTVHVNVCDAINTPSEARAVTE